MVAGIVAPAAVECAEVDIRSRVKPTAVLSDGRQTKKDGAVTEPAATETCQGFARWETHWSATEPVVQFDHEDVGNAATEGVGKVPHRREHAGP